MPNPSEQSLHDTGRRARAAPPPPTEAWRQAAIAAVPHASADDSDFVAMQNALRPTGGLACGNELSMRLHGAGEGGYARLARWIVGRQVFSFAWHDTFWLPMFQFEPHELAPQPALRPVLSELFDVMDGWAIANWFVQPNVALAGQAPVSLWRSDSREVFHAARLQRFVMKG
jgi:hypothetical protein